MVVLFEIIVFDMLDSLLEEVHTLYQELDFLDKSPFVFDKILGKLDRLSQDKKYLEASLSLRWHIYYLKRENILALEDLNTLIKLKPSNRNMFYNRGFLKEHMKKYQEALKDFEKTIHLAKKYKDDELLDAVEHHIIALKERLKR